MNRESRVLVLALGVMLLGTGCAALSSAPAPPVAPRAAEADHVASPPAEPQRPSEDNARILAELAELQNAVARLIATSLEPIAVPAFSTTTDTVTSLPGIFGGPLARTLSTSDILKSPSS